MTNVLIVEDDTSILNSYSFGLTKHGYNVTSSDNARDALGMIKSQAFDVIVLDLLMPEVSGLDFLRQAKPKETIPNTKIIILSNTEAPKIIDQAKELGATYYILKVDNTPSQLCDKIAAITSSTAGAS